MARIRNGLAAAASILGAAGTATAQQALHEFPGALPGDRTGAAVAAAGDVDGDGTTDVAVASPGASGGEGHVLVASGRTGETLLTVGGDGGLLVAVGLEVAAAGDVDADGHDDLLVVSKDLVRVLSGADGRVLHQVAPFEDLPGFATARGVGDVDGDGRDDFLVGVSETDVDVDVDVVAVTTIGPGWAALHSGADGDVLHHWVGDLQGDAFGGAVSPAGDADGDGVLDVAIACFVPSFAAVGGGYLRVLSGAHGGALWDAPDGDGWTPGLRPDLAGDLDGDGVADLVCGLPTLEEVRVLSGATGAELLRIDGPAAGDAFGTAVSGVGDVDLDGTPDLLVGAPQPTAASMLGRPEPLGPGYAEVRSGRTGEVLTRLDGVEDGAELGRALDGLGDVDLDGVPDLVVGSPEHASGVGYAEVHSAGAPTVHRVPDPLDGSGLVLRASFGAALAGAPVVAFAAGPGGGGEPLAPLAAATLDGRGAATLQLAGAAPGGPSTAVLVVLDPVTLEARLSSGAVQLVP